MKFYENIEKEKDRIQYCIDKFGRTSDHNLNWWLDAMLSPEARPVFVDWPDGQGLLAQRLSNEWRIWSDPLSRKSEMSKKIEEFCFFVFDNQSTKKVWCDDVDDRIYPELKNKCNLNLNEIYYYLLWPVLDMRKYDLVLSGGHFKDIRNSKTKFYREHKVEVLNAVDVPKQNLYRIVDDWYKEVAKRQNKEDIFDLKYRNAIKNGFRGFATARVMVVDGKMVGFNAGYKVVNRPERFAGVIGIHDYSIKDLGIVLWLEDLEWIKKAGYKELDM